MNRLAYLEEAETIDAKTFVLYLKYIENCLRRGVDISQIPATRKFHTRFQESGPMGIEQMFTEFRNKPPQEKAVIRETLEHFLKAR